MTNRQRFAVSYTLYALGLTLIVVAARISSPTEVACIVAGIALIFAALPFIPKG